jgi:phosphoribosylformylglycinamidine synthase
MEKLLMEGCLELMSSGLIESMQDMGAAGITSSSVEMASKGNVGVLINLDKVPLRQPLSAYEILLSESQERMLAVIDEKNNLKVKEILQKWQIDYEVIGEITNNKRVVFESNNKKVVDLPVDIIVDDAPEYDREFYMPRKRKGKDFDFSNIKLEDIINTLLSNLNYLDKSWVFNQYDSTVMGDTVKEPGQSSGIVKIHGTQKVIGATTDCNPLYIRINPYEGMKYTVAESYRNLIACNINPLAITNNLNFASPLDPNIMGELVLSIDGLKTAAEKFNTPIVSGNVSLYNQTNEIPIKPTPVIGMVGSNQDLKKINSNKFCNIGNKIIVLGKQLEKNLSPYLLQDQNLASNINEYNDLMELDLDYEKKVADCVLKMSDLKYIMSCNDISRGGVFLSLLKMQYKDMGFKVNIPDPIDLFCEYSAGYVIEIRNEDLNSVTSFLSKNGVGYSEIGEIIRENIEINSKKFDYFDIINNYHNNFEKIIN